MALLFMIEELVLIWNLLRFESLNLWYPNRLYLHLWVDFL